MPNMTHRGGKHGRRMGNASGVVLLTINAITGSDSTSTSRCALTVSTVGAVGADDVQDGHRANEAGFDETNPRSMPL